MIKILSDQNSIFSQYLAEARDSVIQKDSMRFRKNLERMGEIFAYEISKTLQYEKKEVTTTFGIAEATVLKEQPIIASVLRAGLTLHNGMLNFFDHAGNAFVSAYRHLHKSGKFEIDIEYCSSPDLHNRNLILCDPMIATGLSIVLSYKKLLERGRPAHTHIVSVVASVEGLEYLKKHISSTECTVWLGAVDDELTAQAYIVPGLGDAGDLAYGSKLFFEE
jgi:uracil phosphoribosyltransferase